MKKYNTEAIVLKSLNYKDADRVYTLLTTDYGKISAIARGVRKISSRRSGNLDTLNQISVKITESSAGFRNIDEVKTINSHCNLKSNYADLVSAYYITELVHRSLEEESVVPEVFSLLLYSLDLLEEGTYYPKLVVARFEISLLRILGYDINHETASFSDIDKSTIAVLKGQEWFDVPTGDINRIDVVIKSYIYNFLADNMKSLEIMKFS